MGRGVEGWGMGEGSEGIQCSVSKILHLPESKKA